MSQEKVEENALAQQAATLAPAGYVYVWDDWLEESEDGSLLPTVELVKIVSEGDGYLHLRHPDSPDTFRREKGMVALTKEGALDGLRAEMRRKRDALSEALSAGYDVHFVGPDGEVLETVE